MDFFLNFMEQYGLLAMFVLILIEYACFPVSSEIVLPFSGAMAAIQGIPFLIMIPLSILAGIIGTSLCYWVGRKGGIAFLSKITARFPKTKKGIDSSLSWFEAYGTAAVCIGRVIPICRTYIAFAAGAAAQPYHTFFSYSLLGITVWNIALIGLGFFMGGNWSRIAFYYKEYKHILFLGAAFLLLFLLIRKAMKKRSAG